GDVGYEQAKQVNKQNLELDPGDVNDVIRALSEINFKRYIVVEDFHYLPEDTQINFSIALKAFHEASTLCFIIVGVWLEEDRLTVHNGDLTGRVTSINADLWKEEDLDELFTISESLLNISFASQFVQDVKKYCNGSIFLVQRLCHESCKAKNITKTQSETTLVGDDFDVQAKIRELLESQNSRYLRFLTDFSAGFDQTKLDLYKWILFALIETETQVLEKGLPAAAIRRIIEKKHPSRSELSHKKLLQALRKSVDLQVKSRIQPIVFEYDSNTTRVKIVDRSFLLWREFQNKNDLLDHADLTDEIKTSIVTEI
ncbi:TPA: hypothetical protein ACGF2G_003622, partial [Vibrio cholerae]